MNLTNKKYKAHHRLTLVIVVLGSLSILLLLSLFTFIHYKKTEHQATVEPSSEIASQKLPENNGLILGESNHGIPVRIKIPKIKVDAKVIQMGLTKDGDVEAPEKIKDVGWYKYGPRPGNIGNAVLDGHLGVGQSGVFINLHKLKKGDSISVIDDKGHTTTFTVREIQTYDRNEQATEVFGSSDESHLNLITCTGTWDKAINGLPNRLVVFADRVDVNQAN